MTYFKFIVVALLGFVMVGTAQGREAPVPKDSGMRPSIGCLKQGACTPLAMHQGRAHGGRHERHQMHHGMGRGGGGICPQTRTTPTAPDKFLKMKNPIKLTVENLTRGEDLYQWSAEPSACKVCHAASGNGFGMMAQGLPAMPRNFTCPQTMHVIPDGQLFWVIKNGAPAGMPAFKFISDKQIWQLILYIRQFAEE